MCTHLNLATMHISSTDIYTVYNVYVVLQYCDVILYTLNTLSQHRFLDVREYGRSFQLHRCTWVVKIFHVKWRLKENMKAVIHLFSLIQQMKWTHCPACTPDALSTGEGGEVVKEVGSVTERKPCHFIHDSEAEACCLFLTGW